MTDTKLPPIKGAEKIPQTDRSDLSNTRDLTGTALESDRTVVEGSKKRSSRDNDIELGKIQKNSKKVSPEFNENIDEEKRRAL